MKKKFLPLLATTIITATALLPLGISKAQAVSYYPTYSCYYRDIAGSCLSYQTSNPYHLTRPQGITNRSSYGNRLTYPFNSMFNASAVRQSTWDNRYSNHRYRNFRYEEDDDDNDYIDDDDDYYDYHNDDDDEGSGEWRNYYDEDDDTVRPYRYQTDNYYDDDDNEWYNDNDDGYINFEYESTRTYCTGRDCRSYNRY
jgi:hypothetical protein